MSLGSNRVVGPRNITTRTTWSAVRDAAHSYGFAAFTVDPGARGGDTTMTVTYYDVTGLGGALSPFETFELRRPCR